MNCYICNKNVLKSLSLEGVNFGYCDEHSDKVQFGVIKFKLTGNMNALISSKEEYLEAKKSAAMVEFEKQREMFDYDSSITETEL